MIEIADNFSVALFEWAERIQRYEADGWSYLKELMMFVDGGLQDDSFIERASRVLVRGCHEPYCSPYEVSQLETRKANFYRILEIFEVERTREVTLPPTQKPTYRIEPARTKEQPLPFPKPPLAPKSRATPNPTPNPTIRAIPNVVTKDHSEKIAPRPDLIELEGSSACQRSPLLYLICIISLKLL